MTNIVATVQSSTNSSPIQNAAVTLYLGTTSLGQATTDAQGKATISTTVTGSCYLIVSGNGYATFQSPSFGVTSNLTEVDITIVLQPIGSLNEIFIGVGILAGVSLGLYLLARG